MNLKYPYTFQERRVMVVDNVLFLPPKLTCYQTIEWPTNAPFCVELCSGNGEWICRRASEQKECFWVAVEKRFDRVQKIYKRAKREGLSNLFIVFGEAELAASLYFPEKSVDALFINFPDPWPKRRHAKFRLIKKEFLDNLRRILKGPITFVTDDVVYKEEVKKIFLDHPAYVFEGESTELEGYGRSYFEELWKQKGKTIFYQRYANISRTAGLQKT